MMPISYIASGLRVALSDMCEALRCGRIGEARAARDQIEDLIDELEKHDGATERVAANDVEARR